MTESTTSTMTEADARASVRAVVLELAPNGDESAAPDAHLVDDLGFHSLALLELAFTLEDEFDLPPIDEATARQITTILAVENHVVRELTERGEIVAG
ncbi:phosphopantetheine-binding protein [Nonomuraea muscovyensis]|jgi:acyl carrier protein|uniref:Acyl carrier protein n=1 Tax=Nonomuraea muscovyensis TaxID=1124761 RepID=A0A7X0C514_9ACTN|nr:phosphopantetheine-binding protein [Nonomuraea muscovyensis]MBB6347776.1 acyl carrier protein [Nonomuraea muscovyensis]MDF2704692.1 acyl carrier protein [Nonomuraea muscovyensis]